MIESLQGVLSHKSIDQIIVDVHGVGYGVVVPLGTFYKLPDTGGQVRLSIHTHVAQDALKLFGFLEQREKDLFRLLMSVSGIGSRLAINILSGIATDELSGAISGGDLPKLVAIPGVGKKTAERMIFELKDKIGAAIAEEGSAEAPDAAVKDDALSALINLGYKSSAAKDAVDRVYAKRGEGVPLEILLPESLKILSG